ncbi:MAG: 5-oxoprolinase subunit PxpA [Opitutaceae bacterium]|nr:5-oxoprolinase subunit PxpA [Opitutaceae bacterium]
MQPAHSIDLNCDLGESAGHDTDLMPLISSANIACGAHAGNLETMIEAVELAARHGVAIGAHPGYFDLENFGRQKRPVEPDEAARLVLLQLEQIYEVAGRRLRHVKLHGALYNQVCREPLLADGVASELGRLWPHLVVYALAGSAFARALRSREMRLAEEVFADRTYQRDGSLTWRSQPDAMITDENRAVAQVLRILREEMVTSVDGVDLPIHADSVCVHGDGPNAVALARRLREELAVAGIAVKPPPV